MSIKPCQSHNLEFSISSLGQKASNCDVIVIVFDGQEMNKDPIFNSTVT